MRIVSRFLLFKRIKKLGRTLFVLRKPPKHVEAYYSFCVHNIIENLGRTGKARTLALLFPAEAYLFSNKTTKICLQIEHTLVLEGGRGVEDKIYGRTASIQNNLETYLVRIDKSDQIVSANIILEYCMPNIQHVLSSSQAEIYREKVFYVPPFFSPEMANNSSKSRRRDCVLTVMTPPVPGQRRFEILEEISSQGLLLENVENSWGDLSDLYSKTGILLNLHQTEHHHSIEELRILPALLQGVIVVSEKVPLLETVPYRDFLITADREDLAITLRRVMENYDHIWSSIFESKEFQEYRSNQISQLKGTFERILAVE